MTASHKDAVYKEQGFVMRGILLCAAWVVLLMAPVHARDDGYGHGRSDDAKLELKIKGRISPKCEIDLPNRRVQKILTDGPGSESIGFRLNCNQRLSVSMTSTNGGFEHPTRDRDQAFEGFTNFLPYRAQFSVNASNAVPVTANSVSMLGGAGGSIGTIPFNTTGTLELSWAPELPLLGGTYEDTIEIRVSGAGENEIPR